jgi:hypothetical protein
MSLLPEILIQPLGLETYATNYIYWGDHDDVRKANLK